MLPETHNIAGLGLVKVLKFLKKSLNCSLPTSWGNSDKLIGYNGNPNVSTFFVFRPSFKLYQLWHQNMVSGVKIRGSSLEYFY